ncbi:DNA-binding MarR family transcriptional regulator [Tumebacillus sp. BK434]|uniref:MarR family winged helix-turn-helix transcriptional regulator n=1 Tax=Tumebacillus sp. BK434 TaxID=2512169 RepID=UPI00104BA5CE|nr:MarR family transcriptional regulator [Tumebacillus sp. BK434]TCP58222.1 DNA-binding MarR family transcriptional regulator [Tumebacillus sp. BK434]
MRNTVEEQLLRLFRKLSAEYRHELNRDLSGPQVQVLEALDRNGPLKVSDLAERLYVTVGAITLLADRLNKGGYLTRERSEKDRRVVMLAITEPGRELLDQAKVIRKRLFTKYFGILSEEDTADLIRVLTKITEQFEEGNHGGTR